MKDEKTHVFENVVFQKVNEAAKTVFSGPGEMEIGPASEFGGSGQTLNPEELFVAAINGCLMNTFFYFTRKFKIEILSYRSEAQGQLEKQSDGFRFTGVKVQAQVEVSEARFVEKVGEAGRLAKKYCLVSRSVACPVDYQPEVEVEGNKNFGD